MSINLDTTTIAEIPVLRIAPRQAKASPVIIFIPGYGGNKEAGLQFGVKLAWKGFTFLSFDPLYHGERYDRRLDQAADPTLGGLYPPEMGADTLLTMFRVVHHCLQDVQTLLAYLDSDSRVDPSRCGVTGLSMGGYASFMLFANLEQIRTAVPMIGLPQFTQRWIDVLDESTFSNPAWAAAVKKLQPQVERHTRFIEKIDPYEGLKSAAPKPLFMMNCDYDCDQPKLYAVYAYRELQPYYRSDPKKLRLGIYPAGHQVSPEMQDLAVVWFCQHLLHP